MNFMQDATGMVTKARMLGRRSVHHIQVAQRRLKDMDVCVHEIDGMLRGQVPARVLYAGRSRKLAEIRPFLFKGPTAVREIGRATPLSLQACLARLANPQVDILLWEAWPWETSDDDGAPNHSYVVQAWLDAHAAPGTSWQTYEDNSLSENTRRASRRAAKAGFTLQLTTDTAEQETFYHRMLLPMSQHLFGDDGRAPARAAYYSFCSGPEAEVLTLKRDGAFVAGALLKRCADSNELALLYYGALPVILDDGSLRRDVMAALNSWVFREACAAGRQVNLALTRPFLDDGVYNHKRQWGCWLQPLPAFGRYHLQFINGRAADLLQVAPFFHLSRDGVRGVMAFTPTESDPVKELRAQLARSAFPGLRSITVMVRGEQALVGRLATALSSVKDCQVICAQAAPTSPWIEEADAEMMRHAEEFETVTADISLAGALARSAPKPAG